MWQQLRFYFPGFIGVAYAKGVLAIWRLREVIIEVCGTARTLSDQ